MKNKFAIIICALLCIMCLSFAGCDNKPDLQEPWKPGTTQQGTSGGSTSGEGSSGTGNSGGPSVSKYIISLDVNDSSLGEVTGAGEYVEGTSVTIKATAKEGCFFSHWSDNNLSVERDINLDENKNLTAYFYSGNGESIIVNNNIITTLNGTISEYNSYITLNTLTKNLSPRHYCYWYDIDDINTPLNIYESYRIEKSEITASNIYNYSTKGFTGTTTGQTGIITVVVDSLSAPGVDELVRKSEGFDVSDYVYVITESEREEIVTGDNPSVTYKIETKDNEGNFFNSNYYFYTIIVFRTPDGVEWCFKANLANGLGGSVIINYSFVADGTTFMYRYALYLVEE